MIVVPPWDGTGQCDNNNPMRGCQPGMCCSSGGWCGDSPAHCNCEGCKRFDQPFEEISPYIDNVKEGNFSPHFGYVSCFPFIFGLLDHDSGEVVTSETGLLLAIIYVLFL